MLVACLPGKAISILIRSVIGLASIGWRYRKANQDLKNRLSFGAIARLGDIWIAVNDDLRALSFNSSAYLPDPLVAKRHSNRVSANL